MRPSGLTLTDSIQPKAGHFLSINTWPSCSEDFIVDSDEFDKEYFGAETLRVKTGQELIPTLAVQIKVTGRKIFYTEWGTKVVRVKVIFKNDGEPDTYAFGWMSINKEKK